LHSRSKLMTIPSKLMTIRHSIRQLSVTP
jgi:hypothetical protein